ncbi:transposase family protein [Bacteroides ovatus]|nr:transposase family protein [Bacteroides ovatus]
METIIYISIAAVICGAQSWNEIEEFGNAKIAFFKKSHTWSGVHP